MALPQSPMMSKEAPTLVNRPNPSIANGHMPAQASELGIPSRTTNHMDRSVRCPSSMISPRTNTMSSADNAHMSATNLHIFFRLSHLLMTAIPKKYPAMAMSNVYEVISFASISDAPMDPL